MIKKSIIITVKSSFKSVRGVLSIRSFLQEYWRNFCSALLSGSFSSGLLSGIISALRSALSWMTGLISLQLCSPALVMFLQKSTLTSSRLSPCSATPCRLWSVMRTQFSSRRLRSFLHFCSTATKSWSVMCAQPDNVRVRRLGHLQHRQQSQCFFFLYSCGEW